MRDLYEKSGVFRSRCLQLLCSVSILLSLTCSSVQAQGQPHEQILKGVEALRQNDLRALLDAYVPNQELQKMRVEWETLREENVSDVDRQKFDQAFGLLLLPDAEDTLMLLIEPQLNAVGEQWTGMLPVFEGIAMLGVQNSQELDAETRPQATKVIQAAFKWARESDLVSPALAKQAVSKIVTTAQSLGIRNLDDLKNFSFDELLQTGGTALSGFKQVLNIYGISLDNMLDSFEGETISVEGDKATVKFGMTLFGEYVASESEMRLVNGVWVSPKAIEKMSSLKNKNARLDATSATNTVATAMDMPSPVSSSAATKSLGQDKTQTIRNAAQTYFDYRDAIARATTFDEISSFWTSWLVSSAESQTDEVKKAKFEQLLLTAQNIQIVGENVQRERTVLRVVGTGKKGEFKRGRVHLKIEDGVWKIDEIDWTVVPLQIVLAQRPAENVIPVVLNTGVNQEQASVSTQDNQQTALINTETQDKNSSSSPDAGGTTANILQNELDKNPFFKRFNVKFNVQDYTDGFLTVDLSDASSSLLASVYEGFDLVDGDAVTLTNSQDKPAALAIKKVFRSLQKKHSLEAILVLVSEPEEKQDGSNLSLTASESIEEIKHESSTENTLENKIQAQLESEILSGNDSTETELTKTLNDTEKDNVTNDALVVEEPDAQEIVRQARKELVRNIQIRLAELGYAPGPADGQSGPGTRSAINEYQENAELPLTGLADESLLTHLNSDEAVESNIESFETIESEQESEVVEVIEPVDDPEPVVEEAESSGGKIKDFFNSLFKNKQE